VSYNTEQKVSSLLSADRNSKERGKVVENDIKVGNKAVAKPYYSVAVLPASTP